MTAINPERPYRPATHSGKRWPPYEFSGRAIAHRAFRGLDYNPPSPRATRIERLTRWTRNLLRRARLIGA